MCETNASCFYLNSKMKFSIFSASSTLTMSMEHIGKSLLMKKCKWALWPWEKIKDHQKSCQDKDTRSGQGNRPVHHSSAPDRCTCSLWAMSLRQAVSQASRPTGLFFPSFFSSPTDAHDISRDIHGAASGPHAFAEKRLPSEPPGGGGKRGAVDKKTYPVCLSMPSRSYK